MVKEDFIIGKWYGNHPTWKGFYIKCNSFNGTVIQSNEQIHLTGSGYVEAKQKYSSDLKGYKQVEISEIARYLPKNHPDLEQNILNNLQIW